MQAVKELSPIVGTAAACDTLGMSRASFYRLRRPSASGPRIGYVPDWALSPGERQTVLDVLHSERFVDNAPAEIYAALLDEGVYYCSVRTMYRLLAAYDEVRERRDVRRHPKHPRPELLATGPRQLWTWDITKLAGPGRWHHYSLYVIIDVFSRYVPGWLLADRESETLARRLIEETCRKEGIRPGQLTLHADRGAPMTSKSVAQLLTDLDVTRSHSRPRNSDDNPYSEAQFKTMKYRPDFPQRFGSLEDALSFLRGFFPWYNREHRHTGIALLTPETVHFGRSEQSLISRQRVLDAAFDAHPERFAGRRPQVPQLPKEVWINRPWHASSPHTV